MADSHGLDGHMDRKTCYEWGNLFASPWDRLVAGMRSRAETMGLDQVESRRLPGVEGDQWLVWKQGDAIRVHFLFVDDPSDAGRRSCSNRNRMWMSTWSSTPSGPTWQAQAH